MLTFSPNSKAIASGSEDNSVRVWDIVKGISLAESFGFGDGIERLLFSPDSKFLTSASMDCTMVTWNWATDESVGILQGHSGLVTSMLFSPDSSVLASFSVDQTIRIWDWKKGCTHEISGLGAGSRNFRILGIGESIQTNLGEAPLPAEWSWGRSAVEMPFYPELSFDIKTCWVQYRGKDLLRLPAECRDSIYEVHGFTLAVGCQTGRVLIIGLNKAELEKSIGTPKQEPPPQKIREYGAYRAFGSRPTSPTDSWSDGWSS
ncbi:Vegetative incompatibility protein HET-E-1 [Fusarium odoratissimum]|uniref:Vegetative incompatibility protein HET-E-1 n=1 Tax=Fusarium oxysporum f. sp. cubense (strain race 4) TaxID=2502994 RepID=N1S3M3_FUSC4|nr:Vegetative incompatibility protein HET-E-1 [Fusarium odoratissimum]